MRVLIVDDEPDVAELLTMLLQAAGHSARAALTGEGALIAASELEPDIVIVDIHLPDTSGYTLARELRRMCRQRKRLHVVAITGQDARSLPLAGVFDQHAIKPVSAATVFQMLECAREALRQPVF